MAIIHTCVILFQLGVLKLQNQLYHNSFVILTLVEGTMNIFEVFNLINFNLIPSTIANNNNTYLVF